LQSPSSEKCIKKHEIRKKVKCTLVQALRLCTGHRFIGGVEVELYSFMTNGTRRR
jgi:hypothetical protein